MTWDLAFGFVSERGRVDVPPTLSRGASRSGVFIKTFKARVYSMRREKSAGYEFQTALVPF